MLSNIFILQTLNDLDMSFRTAIPPLDSFYSKLALLEVCGWIEEAMDEVLLKSLKYKIKNADNQKQVESAIDFNSAFDYEKNFRKLLIQIIGLMNVEKLEKKVDSHKFQNLKSELGNLKKSRNTAAHEHFQIGITPRFDAPSVTLRRFNRVYEGLEDIESVLLGMKMTKI